MLLCCTETPTTEIYTLSLHDALPISYVIMGIWGIGNAMLIMLAGLQGVPTELYDAAKVDGANSWQTFWKVTFPMLSPVIFYNVVLSVVGLFQYFLVPLGVNEGTGLPAGASMFYNLY